MKKAEQYHILLNSAIKLAEQSKLSSSKAEKHSLYNQLQRVEYELQIVESAFLSENAPTPTLS